MILGTLVWNTDDTRNTDDSHLTMIPWCHNSCLYFHRSFLSLQLFISLHYNSFLSLQLFKSFKCYILPLPVVTVVYTITVVYIFTATVLYIFTVTFCRYKLLSISFTVSVEIIHHSWFPVVLSILPPSRHKCIHCFYILFPMKINTPIKWSI